MRLNSTFSPKQLTRLNPRCQKHELADNEEDGKEIPRAEERAEKALKSTTSTEKTYQPIFIAQSPFHFLQYSKSSSSFRSFRNQCDRLSCPRLSDVPSRPAIVSPAPGLAIGGPNALKSPTLFLKVFQVTHDKTVTKKVNLNFHFFLPRAISLIMKIYQRIPFKNLRALSLSLKLQL